MICRSSGMSSRQWRRLEAELSSTHRVIAPDLLGYGESSAFPDTERFASYELIKRVLQPAP